MNPYEGKPRPLARAAARLALLFALAGLWYRRDALLERVRGAKAGFEAEVEKVQNQGARSAPAPSGGPAPADGPAAGGASIALAPAPPSSVPAPAAPAIARRPPPPDEPEWMNRRLYGVVYELASAAPIAGAVITFKAPNGTTWSVATASDGTYQFDVNRTVVDMGLTVTIAAEGYREGQMEDAEPPYRERSAERRREAASEVAPSDLTPVPLRVRAGEKVTALDFVLLSDKQTK